MFQYLGQCTARVWSLTSQWQFQLRNGLSVIHSWCLFIPHLQLATYGLSKILNLGDSVSYLCGSIFECFRYWVLQRSDGDYGEQLTKQLNSIWMKHCFNEINKSSEWIHPNIIVLPLLYAKQHFLPEQSMKFYLLVVFIVVSIVC